MGCAAEAGAQGLLQGHLEVWKKSSWEALSEDDRSLMSVRGLSQLQ